MALFHPISPEDIQKHFTHTGRMFGFVPVYIGNIDSDVPTIGVRNGWPDFLLDLGEVLFDLCAMTCRLIAPDMEPVYWLTLTGELPRHG